MQISYPSAVSALFVLLLAGCTEHAPPVAPDQTSTVTVPNPASANCLAKGGLRRTEKSAKGEYSVCVFDDNRQCEEWALMRGECPVGGVKVTGYVTEAGRYCAISGGTYAVTSGNDAATEKGTCTLPGGKTCDAGAYYSGDCPRGP